MLYTLILILDTLILILDVGNSFYKHVYLHQVSSYNLTGGLGRRAYTYFREMMRHGGPNYLGKITKSLVNNHKEKILKTPLQHFTDVHVNISNVLEEVSKILALKINT